MDARLTQVVHAKNMLMVRGWRAERKALWCVLVCIAMNQGMFCRLESISTIRSRFLSFLKCSSARGEVVLATSPPLYIFNGTSIIIMKSMEIEIRAKIRNPKKIISSLKKDKGVVFVGEKAEKDIYFKHSTDTDRKLVLRIRRTKNGDMLTFKAKSKGDDTAWPDVDLPLSDAKSLEKILRGSDYEEVITITKNRSTYTKKKFEINIDHLKELGWFIEIEGRGTQKEL